MPPLSELPVSGSDFDATSRAALNRRDALRLLAAGITSGLAACGRPDENIVPYVRMPERVVPGEPLKFATTLPLSGFGRGVLVTSVDGRPIKVEGNPRHPASLGATDVFAEAAVLSLYDPDRSRTVLKVGDIASWEAFLQALQPRLARLRASAGEGLRLLTGHVTSPTLARQIDEVLAAFPKAVWHSHDPVEDASAQAGAALAFGSPFAALPRLERATVILCLDADPLGHGPDQLRNARGFGAHRVPAAERFSRLYVVESTPSLTGAKADHRLALHPSLIGEAAIAVANEFGAGLRPAAVPADIARLLGQAARDLAAGQGAGLVLGGPSLPSEAQALVHWINARIGAPVDLIQPPLTPSGRTPAGLQELARELASGQVQDLVILGSNPAYDAPADLDFAKAMSQAPFRIHIGPYVDETATLSTWHVPQSHVLETWSDLRSVDGTASLVQPLVRPLYGSWTDHQILATLLGRSDAAPYDIVRETWRPQAGADFEEWWTRTLHEGVIANSATVPVEVAGPKLPELGPPPPSPKPDGAGRISVVLRPDPSLWDGSFANNAWLQECPKPLTKQVWGNALALSPENAKRLGVETGDVVRLTSGGRQVEVTVVLQPGHADGTGSMTLGYGRPRAGAIGTGTGANAYAIRTTASPWLSADMAVVKTGQRQPIIRTQNVVSAPTLVDAERLKELFPVLTRAGLAGTAPPPDELGPLPTLLPDRPRPPAEYAWGMVIDASLCIGCNACVVSCQAENNIPVVGPEEVARGRDMHWLRVDVYDHGTPEHPQPGFQPVPCMHCEHAPCEPVCPVAASVHDGEGLNVQVYNRCVGTRFCEANCPYKVRRFNFFGYANGEEYANLGLEPYKAQRNPEVTVRARGVMEKCTYCVQRISAARRQAEREDRRIEPDEVRTACQNACPTRAITFGDLRHAESAVSRLKREERNYALLGHLGTRPRTTYLADIRNPAPELDKERS